MALLYAGKSAAKPDMKPLGPNIADRGSAVYHFSVHQFDSADGKRHYRVWTGVPDRSPPPSGYPVLYMLDGNALMDRLSEDLLKQLTQKRRR
jgi:predicted alpha/beta superfamily hydrolase